MHRIICSGLAPKGHGLRTQQFVHAFQYKLSNMYIVLGSKIRSEATRCAIDFQDVLLISALFNNGIDCEYVQATEHFSG